MDVLAPWESFFSPEEIDDADACTVVGVRMQLGRFLALVDLDKRYEVQLELRGLHTHADRVMRITGLLASCSCARGMERCLHTAAALAELARRSMAEPPSPREVASCREQLKEVLAEDGGRQVSSSAGGAGRGRTAHAGEKTEAEAGRAEDRAERTEGAEPATEPARRPPALVLAKPVVDGPALEIARWLEQLPQARQPREQRLTYVLEPLSDHRTWAVRVVLGRRLKSGRWGVAKRFDGLGTVWRRAGVHMGAEDAVLLRWLMALRDPMLGTIEAPLTLAGGATGELMRRLVATGLCFLGDHGRPLALGEPLAVAVRWREEQGSWRLGMQAGGTEVALLATDPPWYLAEGLTGPCTGISAATITALLRMPPVPSALLPQVLERLGSSLPEAPAPPVPAAPVLPTGELVRVHGSLRWWHQDGGRGRSRVEGLVPLAVYAGVRAQLHGDRPLTGADGQPILRHQRCEQALAQQLAALGLEHISEFCQRQPLQPTASFPEALGSPFVHRASAEGLRAGQDLALPPPVIAALLAAGWHVVGEEHQPPALSCEAIEAAFTPIDGQEALRLDLGLQVGSERIDLVPVVVHLLEAGLEVAQAMPVIELQERRWACVAHGTRVVRVPLTLLENILAHLKALAAAPASGAIRATSWEALGWEGVEGVRALLPQRLVAIAERLRGLAAPGEAPLPPGCAAELRSYQRRGLTWLQGLSEAGAGGILADDMGLGKTVQAIAHLLAERAAGRLATPALVVAPASVLGTWRRECARFAPALRVLVHHGPDRCRSAAALQAGEVVVTSYAIALRDRTLLGEVEWSVIIADEAQVMSASTAKSSVAVRSLHGRQRLALSGTPLSNHLGELHTLMSWAMPGLLGSPAQFKRIFRTPIEDHGDQRRTELLRRRIAPFLLRRTKEAVAPELPPRSQMVVRLTLAEGQRELYESIRLAMDQRIREVLSAKGLAGGRFEVLECLGRLRLCCCDPRLVRRQREGGRDAAEAAEAAEAGAADVPPASAPAGEGRRRRGRPPKVRRPEPGAEDELGSAKLSWLRQALPEMIEEGRRILLFSSFTSWLDLVERDVLAQLGIAFLRLDGSTTKRDEVVARFQAREAPLFLLSLKAGGVGLTLTAADSVIIADPWWNPAAENQAADRAHRIGQDQPVFIYRLVAEDTVEDRILVLQERKRALAALLVDADGQAIPRMTEAELMALVAPLPV